MPESSGLILKRVNNVPVVAPASIPATNPASDASNGLTPRTISVAATAAPRVIEPSAGISGKAKMRKLMNTPSASRERMKPMVKVPISRFMCVGLSSDFGGSADPTRASDEFALLRAGCLASVGEQVQHALQSFRLE